MLNDNAHSTGSSSSRDNDGYGEENRHTAEQLLTVTRSSRTATLYKQADYLYIPYGMLHSYIILYKSIFDNLVSDTYQVTNTRPL